MKSMGGVASSKSEIDHYKKAHDSEKIVQHESPFFCSYCKRLEHMYTLMLATVGRCSLYQPVAQAGES